MLCTWAGAGFVPLPIRVAAEFLNPPRVRCWCYPAAVLWSLCGGDNIQALVRGVPGAGGGGLGGFPSAKGSELVNVFHAQSPRPSAEEGSEM